MASALFAAFAGGAVAPAPAPLAGRAGEANNITSTTNSALTARATVTLP